MKITVKATTAREINILIGDYRNWLLVITLEVGFVNTLIILKSQYSRAIDT